MLVGSLSLPDSVADVDAEETIREDEEDAERHRELPLAEREPIEL